jgi:hypothetical protein
MTGWGKALRNQTGGTAAKDTPGQGELACLQC